MIHVVAAAVGHSSESRTCDRVTRVTRAAFGQPMCRHASKTSDPRGSNEDARDAATMRGAIDRETTYGSKPASVTRVRTMRVRAVWRTRTEREKGDAKSARARARVYRISFRDTALVQPACPKLSGRVSITPGRTCRTRAGPGEFHPTLSRQLRTATPTGSGYSCIIHNTCSCCCSCACTIKY